MNFSIAVFTLYSMNVISNTVSTYQILLNLAATSLSKHHVKGLISMSCGIAICPVFTQILQDAWFHKNTDS